MPLSDFLTSYVVWIHLWISSSITSTERNFETLGALHMAQFSNTAAVGFVNQKSHPSYLMKSQRQEMALLEWLNQEVSTWFTWQFTSLLKLHKICILFIIYSKTWPPILMKLCTLIRHTLRSVTKDCYKIPFTNK